MKYPDRDKFLESVFETMRESVEETKSEHPHDIMCQILSSAETLYRFSERMDWTYNA